MDDKNPTSHSPLVSVIAVCYNHERFVVECLESITAQSYKNIELIIMDDCSQDRSVDVIKNWITTKKIPCTFIAHQQNIGLCKTLNEALKLTKGEYMAIIATDDVWMEHKLEQQINWFKSCPPDVGMIYGDAQQIDPEGNPLPQQFMEAHCPLSKAPEGNIFSRLIEGNFIPAPSVLIRKQCFDQVGTYDERLCYEDWDMWLRISQHFAIAFSPITATKYRIVPTSLNRTMLTKDHRPTLLSNFLIAKKCLKAPMLPSSHKSLIKGRLTEYAYKLHALDDRHQVRCLFETLRYDFRLKTLLFFFCSLFKIPPNIENRIVVAMKSIKNLLIKPMR